MGLGRPRAGAEMDLLLPRQRRRGAARFVGRDRAQRSGPRPPGRDHGRHVDHLRPHRGLRGGRRPILRPARTRESRSGRLRRVGALDPPRVRRGVPEPLPRPRRLPHRRLPGALLPRARRRRRPLGPAPGRAPRTGGARHGRDRLVDPARDGPPACGRVVGGGRDGRPAGRAGGLGRRSLRAVGPAGHRRPGAARNPRPPPPADARLARRPGIPGRAGAGPDRRPPKPTERIMAIPTGVASTDMALAWEIYRRARAAGLGREIDLSS